MAGAGKEKKRIVYATKIGDGPETIVVAHSALQALMAVAVTKVRKVSASELLNFKGDVLDVTVEK